MAKKLFLLYATLAFCVILTNASNYRTVVEFDDDKDDVTTTNFRGNICDREYEESQNLKACKECIQQQMMRQGEGGRGEQDQPPQLRRCCAELNGETPLCVCRNLQRVAQEVGFELHQIAQVKQIYETAKNLPDVCIVMGVGVCPFDAPLYFTY